MTPTNHPTQSGFIMSGSARNWSIEKNGPAILRYFVTSFLCVIPYPPSLFHRRQLDAEDLAIDVVELHGQRPRAMIDPTAAEELKRLAWRPVRLQARRNAQEFHLGTKGPIHLVRAEGAGVQRPRHELPEWIELGEARARRTVVMGRTVVAVRRQPHHVADVTVADELQHPRDLELPAERRTVVFVCHRLEGTA